MGDGRNHGRFRPAVTRRGFLHTSGLGLTGIFIGSPLFLSGCAPQPGSAVEAPAPEAEYGPFKMSFQSYSLRHFESPDDFLAQAEKLDLPYVELWRGHLAISSSSAEIDTFKSRLQGAGLQPAAFGVERFTADHEQNRTLFDFGKKLGVQNLSADPAKDAFSSLQDLVQEYDIRIAIHNHGPEDERWKRPEWILEAVQDLDPRIGSCADLGHFIRADVDPVEAIRMLGSRVLGVHLKDFNAEGQDVVVGTGRLDLVGALAALQEIGFDGPLSLEYEGDRENPVPKMLEALAVVRQAVQQI